MKRTNIIQFFVATVAAALFLVFTYTTVASAGPPKKESTRRLKRLKKNEITVWCFEIEVYVANDVKNNTVEGDGMLKVSSCSATFELCGYLWTQADKMVEKVKGTGKGRRCTPIDVPKEEPKR